MKKVLLLNAEGVQTICLARSLRIAGHHVVGFCNHKISSGYATRWLSEKHKTPDIAFCPVEFNNYLTNYLDHNVIDLIIPLADDGAEFLSKNKEDIEGKYNVQCAIPKFEVFGIANDKQKLMELCERYEISHPRTVGLPPLEQQEVVKSSFMDTLRAAANYVGFPALIKPNKSQGAKGIVKIENFQDLIDKYKEIYNVFGKCSLQEYIDQPDYYYNVMLYRDKSGGMDNYTIIKIRRFFPLKGGSSCYCETIKHALLLKQCQRVLDILNWTGFADFDVLEDKKSGKLKIIEINPRVPSSFQASFAAGIDFGKVFISDIFDSSILQFEYKTGKQVRWMGLDVMWFMFSKDRFSFKPSWFKFFGKDVSYHDGSFTDPWPMLAGIFAGVIKYLNPNYRKAKFKS